MLHARVRAEVILNGDYQGRLYADGKIKVDDGRVDIASLKPDEVTGDGLTGGYILRVDKIDGGNDYPAWNSGGLDFQYFDPAGEDLVAQQQVIFRTSSARWILPSMVQALPTRNQLC